MNENVEFLIWVTKYCGNHYTECYTYQNKYYYIDSDDDMRDLYELFKNNKKVNINE